MSQMKEDISYRVLISSPRKSRRRDGWFWMKMPRGMSFWLTGIILTITTLFTLLTAYLLQSPTVFPQKSDYSVTVLDRDGHLLRAFTTNQGRWRLPVSLEEVDPIYIKMLLAYEDKRFFSHHGVDLWAMGRAVKQFILNGRIISGGSTLTMQVARLLEPRKHRSIRAKLKQILRAISLEQHLTKQQILTLYLNLAPMGGNLEGVRAASLSYFNREPKRLTRAQAAQLVAIPQSPEYRRPDKSPKATLKSRNIVLKRVARLSDFLSEKEARQALTEVMPTKRLPFPKYAAHLTQSEVLHDRAKQVHRLTIDIKLQRKMEKLVSSHARRFSKHHAIAMIIAENVTGDVLTHIGAPDFLKQHSSSHIDMTRAWRSPGSTLKPFIYGMGFEDGFLHPQTLIKDQPTRFGAYKPKNFDGGYYGTVTIRKALQMSLNIPAVKVLHKVGAGRLIARFQKNNIGYKLPKGAKPNIALALGGLGMRLTDLTTLYMGLARGGQTIPLNWHQQQKFNISKAPQAQAILSPIASWYIGSILQGTSHTNKRTPFAYKTGTSYGYRDAWVVGYDQHYTVAIWVGRPDGTASPGMTGNGAAVPILLDAFKRLNKTMPLSRRPPAHTLLAQNTALPLPLQNFESLNTASHNQQAAFTAPVHIAFPRPKTILSLRQNAQTGSGAFEAMMIKAEGGALPLTWLINGRPIKQSFRRRSTFWTPREEGFVRLGVIDALGRSDSILVRVN